MKILTVKLWESCRNNINDIVYSYEHNKKKNYIPNLKAAYDTQEMMRQIVRLTVNEIMEEDAKKPKLNLYPDNIMVDYDFYIGEKGGVEQKEIQNWIWSELKNTLNAEDGVFSGF